MNKLHSVASSVIAAIALSTGGATPNASAMPVPQLPADSVIVEGSASVGEGGMIVLFLNRGDAGSAIAPDTIRNGRFRLSALLPDDCDDPARLSVMCFAPGFPSMGRSLLGRPGARIKVDASTPYIKTWPVESTVNEQQEIDCFLTDTKAMWDTLQSRRIRMAAIKSQLRSDTTLTEASRNRLKQQGEEAGQLCDALTDSIALRDVGRLSVMPHTELWFDKFVDMARSCSWIDDSIGVRDGLKAINHSLPDDEKELDMSAMARSYLFPRKVAAIGDPMVDADLLDPDGNIRHLAEYKGKWILLDFWSGGCGPCNMAAPELEKFAAAQPDSIVVVSVSTDDDRYWRQSTERLKISGNNWNDPMRSAGLFLDYGCQGLPTYVVIDPDGLIRHSWMGYTPGCFKRNMRPFIQPRKPMTIEQTPGLTAIISPRVAQNNTNATLDIDRIELTPGSTRITFHAYYIPKWWIKVSPDSHITLPDGTNLGVTGSEGITLGEEYRVGDDGEGTFSLTFGPLPEGTATIDFAEPAPSQWSIKGISVDMAR